MNTSDNYLFVDGSALLADIGRLWSSDKEIAGKKLDVVKFCSHFVGEQYMAFVPGYRRFTLYFVDNEPRINRFLTLPDFKTPNVVDDLHIKYCGRMLSGGKRLRKWVQDNSPPKFVTDKLSKAEKAVDTQICCDALQLAGLNRLSRLLLYTNDYDFMPLLNTLRTLGCNVSLFRLTAKRVNSRLVGNSDSFHVPNQEQLHKMFS